MYAKVWAVDLLLKILRGWVAISKHIFQHFAVENSCLISSMWSDQWKQHGGIFDGPGRVICLQAVPAGLGLYVKGETFENLLTSGSYSITSEDLQKKGNQPPPFCKHKNQMIMWFQLNTCPDNCLITPNCWWFQPELTCWFQQCFLTWCYLCLIVCWFMAWVQASHHPHFLLLTHVSAWPQANQLCFLRQEKSNPTWGWAWPWTVPCQALRPPGSLGRWLEATFDHGQQRPSRIQIVQLQCLATPS